MNSPPSIHNPIEKIGLNGKKEEEKKENQLKCFYAKLEVKLKTRRAITGSWENLALSYRKLECGIKI